MSKEKRVRKAMIEVVEAMGTEWAADEIIRLRKELDDSIQETNRMHAGPPHINDYDVKGQ